MSDRVLSNPNAWAPLSETVAAGYRVLDEGGLGTVPVSIRGRMVAALVVHEPDTTALRAIRLTDAEHMAHLLLGQLIRQEAAPTAEQVAAAWQAALPLVERFRQHVEDLDPETRRLFDRRPDMRRSHARRIGQGLTIKPWTPSQLKVLDRWLAEQVQPRQEGEDAEAFYRRIASAFLMLAGKSETPTADLADLAGVPPGTAASWVSRARQRGLIAKPKRSTGGGEQ